MSPNVSEPSRPSFSHRLGAEFLGTFMLVFGGVGSSVYSTKFPEIGIGILGVSLAFGLSLLAGVWALGAISGGHFNPAVTFGLCAARRFEWKDMPGYVAAQLIGAFLASCLILYIAQGLPDGYSASVNGLGANGYGAHSPNGYSLYSGIAVELTLSFAFVLVVVGATAKSAPTGLAALPIGLMLALVHLVSIPITNTSVNPARTTGPAILIGGWALEQLWLFWVAPLVGGLVAGFVGAWLHQERHVTVPSRAEPRPTIAHGPTTTTRGPEPMLPQT